MRLFKRASPGRSLLSVILTSDRAELAVALVSPEGVSRIVFATSALIDMRKGPKPLLTRLTDALSTACEATVKEGLSHIVSRKVATGHFDTIRVFYGAPWYLSRGRHVTIERGDSSPISTRSLHTLMERSIEGLIPKEMGGAVILEEHAHGFTINGYPVEDPVGKNGTEIGMRLFVSAVDDGTKNAVEGTLGRFFHAREIVHASALLPFVKALARMEHRRDGYMLVEVSGYMTEVSKVERGMVTETISFPEGHETLLKKTVGALKRPHEEAKTLVERRNDFGLTPEFQVAHDDALSGWSREFADAIAALGGRGVSSGTILLAETPSADAFKREITRIVGGSVLLLAKEAFLPAYSPSARPNARVLSALLTTG